MSKLKIFIAGHKGMVGSAIIRALNNQEVEIITRDRTDLDLLDQDSVQNFFKKVKIDQVYLAAAKVGGIHSNNTYPGEFIYENLMIQTNIIHSAFLSGVKKLLFLGSSCIYPKNAKQPIREQELFTGELEPTNEPYAIAKITGIKTCESYNRQYGKNYDVDYRSIMPTNLYGPGDNYHPLNSHVIPGLIYRFHQAKVNNTPEVIVWGSGEPKREFLHVDDMARASIFLMNIDKETYYRHTKLRCSHINVGSGSDISIKDLAHIIKEVVGYKGNIYFDNSKPDGTFRKLLNSGRINDFGFKAKISLEKGLSQTYQNFKSLYENP